MRTIVVIEDDPAIAGALRAMLEDAFHVHIVSEPPTLAAGLQPVLVITDLMSQSGYDSGAALRTVREIRAQTDAPVVVLTAHAEALRDDALARETDAILSKPFDMDVLLATVVELTA